jgi:hypothetical protein
VTRETLLKQIKSHPSAYEPQQDENIRGPGDETTYAFQAPLRQTGALNVSLLQFDDIGNVLVDVIRQQARRAVRARFLAAAVATHAVAQPCAYPAG